VADREVLEGGAGVPDDVAGRGVEHRPAPAAALPVALVGGGDQAVADPLHRVGLARDVDGVERVEDAVVGGVDVGHPGVAGGEDRRDRAGRQVDDDEAVVLLQGQHDLVVGVDVDVLRLGVLRGVETGRDEGGERVAVGLDERHLGRGPRRRGGGGQVEHLQGAGGQLRQVALVAAGRGGLLVALVLHRDRGVVAVGAHRDRVGLTAEVEGVHDRAGGEVDDVDAAGRVLEVAR
jgi:hypothetical protein